MRTIATLSFVLLAACGSDNKTTVDAPTKKDATDVIDAAPTPDGPAVDSTVAIDSAPAIDASVDGATMVDASVDGATMVDASIDGATMVDASVDGTTMVVDASVDAAPAACLVVDPVTYTPMDGVAAQEDSDPPESFVFLDDFLNNDPLPDGFEIGLLAGFGAFSTTDISAPMTIDLSGDETDYNTCGACVQIFADTDADGNPTQYYIAQSGTLKITSVSGRFTGELIDVKLAAVVYDDDGNQSLDPSGCTTTIVDSKFDVPLAPTFTGKKPAHKKLKR